MDLIVLLYEGFAPDCRMNCDWKRMDEIDRSMGLVDVFLERSLMRMRRGR
jgi:hypothetical protein